MKDSSRSREHALAATSASQSRASSALCVDTSFEVLRRTRTDQRRTLLTDGRDVRALGGGTGHLRQCKAQESVTKIRYILLWTQQCKHRFVCLDFAWLVHDLLSVVFALVLSHVKEKVGTFVIVCVS